MKLIGREIDSDSVLKTELKAKMTIDGITDTYPIYRVKLNRLFYNDQNDRISTWISQYISEKGKEGLNNENMEKYNDIIQKFIEDSNPDRLKQTQANIELLGQQKYGVVLNDGRIIDGNRRFACLRNLSKKSDSFNYFETVILDKDYENSAKQIKMLELSIQIGEEARLDYDPIDRIVGLYRDVIENELLTKEEYSRSTGRKIKEVEDDLEVAKLLVEFLESIKAPGQFYLARVMKLESPLREMYKILKKISNEDKKQELKYIIFANILVEPQADTTRYIRKFSGIANSVYVDEIIEKEMEIAEEVLDGIPNEKKVSMDTISKVRADSKTKNELEKITEVVSNKAKARETRNRPNQLLIKIADLLQEVDVGIIRKLSDEQKDEINENIERIEEKLADIKEVVSV